MVTDASSYLMQELRTLKGVTVGRLETATGRGLSDRVLKPLHRPTVPATDQRDRASEGGTFIANAEDTAVSGLLSYWGL